MKPDENTTTTKTLPELLTPHPLDPNESLRDRFAMAALTGLLSWSEANASGVNPLSYLHNPDDAANKAYAFADAMLRARSR